MLESIKRSLAADEPPDSNYECRFCGTPVESRSSPCPACGSREIGAYEL